MQLAFGSPLPSIDLIDNKRYSDSSWLKRSFFCLPSKASRLQNTFCERQDGLAWLEIFPGASQNVTAHSKPWNQPRIGVCGNQFRLRCNSKRVSCVSD